MPSTEISERWRRIADPGDALSWCGEAEFVLLHGAGEWEVFGEDPLLLVEDFDLPSLSVVREGELPPILPDFLGFATYEAGDAFAPELPPATAAPWPFPQQRFALHRRVVLRRSSGEAWEAVREGPPSLGLRRDLDSRPFRARRIGDSDDAAGYAAKVQAVRDAIRRGEVYQANLCRQESWAWEGDLVELAGRLRSANPAPFSALLAGAGWAVLSTSPERLLRIHGRRIESRPIKGTAPRGATRSEDAARAAELLASAKDRAELAMIADLVRNDLARVCRLPSVVVEAFPQLETHPNVHHLVATMAGELRSGVAFRELMGALFPAGSISGCPKRAALALLRGLEPQPRLASTGALGWFRHDLGQADLAVAIRTLSLGPGELRLGLGSGITWDSEPEAEYQETVHKGSALVEGLTR